MNQPKKEGICALCGREKPLTFHHLIPKSNHKNKWFRKHFDRKDMQLRGIKVCRPCHNAIHRFHDEKTLGREFNTREALLADPALQKFIRWVRKQR